MDQSREHCTTEARRVDFVVTGVDDLDVIATAEAEVREAFSASAAEGRWTVALRPRHGVGGWAIGVIVHDDGASAHEDLKIESSDSLRERMIAIFLAIARSRPEVAPAGEVA